MKAVQPTGRGAPPDGVVIQAELQELADPDDTVLNHGDPGQLDVWGAWLAHTAS
jgi:hypothetical protein